MGNRILAGLIDSTISLITIGLIALMAWGIFTVVSMGPLPGNVKGIIYGFILMIAMFIAFFIHFGYHIFFEGTWQGQTPGKKVAQIRVIEQNGQPVTWPAVIIRNVLRVVDMGLVLIGVLSMMIDKNERRFGDLAAGTVVIRERSSELLTSSQDDLRLESSSSGDSSNVDVGRITPQEYEILVSFLKRRDHMAKAQRPVVAAKLQEHFKVKLGDVTAEAAPEAYLEAIYRSYRTRALA
ncbi:MAG: RDD family protein [Leptolyngbya sp.]|nr:RDD family protein [Candidatus Melainabacteria bacterium]